MAEWEHAVNAYEVLGLSQGPKATDGEISKAYRAAALRYHPDKNKGDVEGAKNKFQAAKDARDLLSDAKARVALDALLSARAAREAKFAGQDEKRRRMREKLERDEKVAATGRSEESDARSRLQAELGRLKREAAARRAAQQAAQQSAGAAAAQQSAGAAAAATPAVDAPPVITEDLLRTLKVSWSVKAGGYTSQQLWDAFTNDGPVEDVILRASKRRSKGSALVVMRTRAGAAAAAAAPHGDPANPLLVVPFLKVPVESAADSLPAVHEVAQQSAAASPQAANSHSGAADNVAAGAAAEPHPGQTAPLFPLNDDTATGLDGANGWTSRKPQAPLFPSFGDANSIAAAPSAAPPVEAGDEAPPPPAASSCRMPTASSFRPPPSGLFNAGVFGAVPRPSQNANGAAAAEQPQRADADGGSAANEAASAGRQAAGEAVASQLPQPAAAASRPGQRLQQATGRIFETPTEADLRRADERARLIAEMEAEDAAEIGG